MVRHKRRFMAAQPSFRIFADFLLARLTFQDQATHERKSLNGRGMDSMEFHANPSQKNIALFIPKLSITASYDIKTVLQRMGMTAIFNDSADLSGITGQRNLKVSKVSGSQAVKGFISDYRNLELILDFDGEPVKLVEDWGYMRIMPSPRQQPGHSILHHLKYPDCLQGQLHVEHVTEIQLGSHRTGRPRQIQYRIRV
ncbi:Alpha-1-antitrypsin [Varanus komodoensis]|nr:Alpha-1-antitrypsin [Varanus komodoensis]